MTKPTLLPGGCAKKHGVATSLFQFRLPYSLIVALTGFFAVVSLQAADVSLYSVTKGMRYIQTSEADPEFLPLNEYVFEANVFSVESNVIRYAMVEATNNIDRILEMQDPTEYQFDDLENDPRDLGAKYPNGRYRFRIRTWNDGWRTNLSLMLTGRYPTRPKILNYTALQSASGHGYVDVQWSPFENGTAADSIQLRIETASGLRAFATSDFGEPGALDGRATNVVIEPGNLAPDTTYFAWLEFRRTSRVNTNSYPGATGWAYLHRRTEFRIKTSSDGLPDLVSYEVSKGQNFAQLNANAPEPAGTNAFEFSAEVQGQLSNSVTSASLTAPNNAPIPLIAAGNEWGFLASSDSPMDSTYPGGTYTFNWNTTNAVSLNLPLTPYPPAPHIRNFDPSQPIQYGAPLSLEWDAWPDGQVNDLIQLQVRNNGTNAFDSGDFGDNDALNGFATSVFVPAEVFVPGEDYTVRLTFRRFTDLTTTFYPGVLGAASYFSRTEFEIKPIQDVESYEVAKGRLYIQTNTLAPIPAGTNAYQFSAEVQGQFSNSVTSATIRLPNNNTDIPLTASGTEWSLLAAGESPLDATYPGGVYTFNLTTRNDGARNLALNLPLSSYPPAPHVNNYDPSQPIVFGSPLSLEWDAWPGGQSNDFIQIQVRNNGTNAFETGDFGDIDALNGFATGVTVPAEVFVPGEDYTVRLTFRRFTDLTTTQYPGAFGAASYFSRTEFEIVPLQDVESYEVAKGRHYIQTNTLPAIPDGTNAHRFSAELQAQSSNTVLSASLGLPNGLGTITLTNNGGDFAFTDSSADPLDTAYPDGEYAFTAQTLHQGAYDLRLSLTGDEYPPAPRFLHDPAQRLAEDQPIDVTWEPWSGGTASDFVQLQIRDSGTNVFETPDFAEPGALNGLATNAIIPAGVLTGAERYTARLVFQRVVDIDTNSFPKALGRAYYYARTDSDLRTVQPDVEDYEIEKGISFVQLSPTEIVTEPGEEFLFNAQVQGSSRGLIASAILFIPNGAISNMTPTDTSLEQFEVSAVASTNADFELNYPPGTYRFEVETSNDGTQSLSLVVTNAVYPPMPRITNFQFNTNSPILAGPPVVLEWEPWADGTTNDFIQVQIRDSGTNVFETPDFGDPGALNGLSTNAVIPADALLPGKNYSARVFFRRFVLSEEPVPGTVGTVSFFSRTKFDISTFDPDVSSYRLFKGAEYVQTSTNEPAVVEYVIDSVLEGRFDDGFQARTLLGATLTPPGRDPVSFVPDDDEMVWTLRQSFATRQELDDAFPDGPYVIIMDGIRYGATNVTVHLTNDIPNPPHLVNYDAVGRIVSSQPFILEWDPFVGGTATDYISNRFVNAAGTVVYATPAPEDAAALNGLRTTTSLNAATLSANSIFNATLRFEKVLLNDSTNLVEVPGRAGYYSQTAFRAVTTGAGNPPRFSARLFELTPPNQVQFVVATIPGGAYVFEGSTNLVDWSVITNISATTEFYTNSVTRPGPMLFIRGSLLR